MNTNANTNIKSNLSLKELSLLEWSVYQEKWHAWISLRLAGGRRHSSGNQWRYDFTHSNTVTPYKKTTYKSAHLQILLQFCIDFKSGTKINQVEYQLSNQIPHIKYFQNHVLILNSFHEKNNNMYLDSVTTFIIYPAAHFQIVLCLLQCSNLLIWFGLMVKCNH